MTRLLEALRRITADLDALGQRWCLVGGLAVSARAEPRTTRDIDLAVAVEDDRQAERLVRELQARGYGLVAHLEQETAGRLATVRLLPAGEPEEGIVLDLLFASSGLEPEIVEAAERVEIVPGLAVPLARRPHLLAAKLLAGRPQDLIDARALLAEAAPGEVETARELLALIAHRGFHRGKDLLGELSRLVAGAGAG
jgi:hypothetical protein